MHWFRILGLALAVAGTAASAQTTSGKEPASPRVLLATTLGDITLQLDAQRAPKTVENFLAYVRSGHYDGTIFHRVIDGFMIQGGGFTPDMKQKPTRAPIPLESRNGLKNVRGTVAMARTSMPDSATAQFYINVVDNPGLDYPQPDGHGYAVFGRVIGGMEVVDKIRAVPTGPRDGHQNVPLTPVVIRSARILN
ncbi:MAG: peptidylprolyl isomerase [Sutterellaceae bacterium]|nr:peptidylprolyl isomerase [Burkholderiaceae bacterium]MCX7902153.1 peptidylprolyl isomerase [Burkholderiaceae bacterium]MDW8430241.1 peptidylprolyl isomerase [Sutterellaceae bacterium]